ncbi:MAG: UDP-N-acetylglucosamine diphosphorylase/glucosamine-1-phosphate N-acetyltransferase [Chloroflexi bacterium 44-23]|nr:MAG: UDP-N-acetylglucosamine diphosphorylase/glucosamine-1-phosphate N-acetyltransferase [Chloroflexi bacterium 44-23]
MKVASVILAAGKGTRMRSDLPKVLHKICGYPLIHYACEASRALGIQEQVVVVGHGSQQVQAYLGDQVLYALQEQQLGTAHAVLAAREMLAMDEGLILVTSGDMPLLTAQTLQELVSVQRTNSGPLTMLVVTADDPRGFGRVIRGSDAQVLAVVEEAQASPDQLKIRELNAGAYCFDAAWLWQTLENLPLSPKGEYYLTDTIAAAVEQGKPVAAVSVADELESMGINTRIHLAEAEAAMQQRILNQLMLAGVTIINPPSTYIEASVRIGQDTIIYPNTFLRGETQIGKNCEIGPNTIATDCKIGNQCKILAAVMEKAIVEDSVDMGPFVRLRKGAHLGEHVHMGNFGEVKDSYLGEGTKMGHFSYIGNATIGKNVNIGAGTITCNYDGQHKHATIIGDNVFIGSDTMLVAPLTIGKNASTGAGAVVTHDVREGEVVVGVPAKALRKKNIGE